MLVIGQKTIMIKIKKYAAIDVGSIWGHYSWISWSKKVKKP
jgi:hypothetical protein